MVRLNQHWCLPLSPRVGTKHSRKTGQAWQSVRWDVAGKISSISTWYWNHLRSRPHQTECLSPRIFRELSGSPVCTGRPGRQWALGRVGAWCESSCPRWLSRTGTISPGTSPAPGWSAPGKLRENNRSERGWSDSKLTEKYEECGQLGANQGAAVGNLHHARLTLELGLFSCTPVACMDLLFGGIKDWLNTLFGVFINKYLLSVKSQQEA